MESFKSLMFELNHPVKINRNIGTKQYSFLKKLKSFFSKTLLIATFTFLGFVNPATANNTQEAINDLYQKMPQLDEDFQLLSDAFFSRYTKNLTIATWQNLNSIDNSLLSADAHTVLPVIAAAKKNLSVVCSNYAVPQFSVILELLYQHNETATIKQLTDCIKQKGDAVAKAENYFQLAQYYYARKQWQGVIAALSQVNRKDLSVTDSHYADLLKGFALQSQKKHRDAVKIYKQIPTSSPYYAYAKLNEGIGYLRQGWWTEAHIEIKAAINSIKSQQNEEFKNRLLVVLGYSQLDYEFYRDARDTLRNVTLVSNYTNKALMGLGLAAAYQEDYVGALNAFNRLANNSESDLSVDESYLLVPNAYEELGDNAQAADAYLRAIEYYKKRINRLHTASAQLGVKQNVPAPILLEQLDSRADELYGAKNLIPPYIVKNYHSILAFKAYAQNLGLSKKIEQLELQYDKALKALVQNNISLRESILNSYLSQAKYGVAKLYDQP